MLLGMPWRPRATPVVILRLRILGRVCNLHRTMSVVHRTVLMSYCVCLASPTNARPGGVGIKRSDMKLVDIGAEDLVGGNKTLILRYEIHKFD